MPSSSSAPKQDARREIALKRAMSNVWVRFNGSLEDEYLRHAERRAQKLIHRTIYILFAIFLIVVIPVNLLTHYDNLSTWRNFGVYPIAGSLILLFLAIKTARLQRWVTTVIGLALMISLAGTLLGAIHMSGTFLGLVCAFETIYVLIIGYSILRLPPTRTLFWCLGSLIVALLSALVLGWRVDPVSLLLFYGFPLMVCTLNGYMLDASARTTWANNQLLQRESDRLRQWRDNADRETRRQRALNEFMAHIAGNPTVAVLMDQALEYLIAHSPALAGAAYRLDDDALVQEAARGLNETARQRRSVERGGLLDTALERGSGVTVHHQVPAGYLDLETGQSVVRPAHLLMMPVWQGEHALGVIELASLDPFDEDSRTLIESLATPLAYALMAAVGREDYIRRHQERDAG